MSTVNGFQVGSETLKYNYESLDNYNTPNFSTSSSTTYAVGDYVMYNGKLYKCTTATTGGTWVGGNWTEAVLSDEVSDLTRQLSDVEENQIPELKSALTQMTFTTQITLSDYTVINGSVHSNGKWYSSANQKYRSYAVPNASYTKVDITAQETKSAYISFLKGESIPTPVDGQTPNYCVGESNRHTITANTTATLSVPDDCTWLIITQKYQATVYTPDNVVGKVEIAKIAEIDARLDALAPLISEHPYDHTLENAVQLGELLTGYIRKDNGAFVSVINDYKCTDYIPIIGAPLYMMVSYPSNDASGTAFYDANKNFIVGYGAEQLGSANTIVTLTSTIIPNNACYIRMTRRNTSSYKPMALYVPFLSDNVSKIAKRFIENKTGDQTNPLSEIIQTGGQYGTLNKVGIIGDSLSVGGMNTIGSQTLDPDVTKTWYSWPKILERMTGVTTQVFAHGGYNTGDWLTTYGNNADFITNWCMAYIIGLGENDRSSGTHHLDLGTESDVSTTSREACGATYYGNLANIVLRCKEAAEKARIFLLTNPRPEGESSGYNAAVRYVANAFGTANNVFLVDLYTYAGSIYAQYITDQNYWYGGHLTAIGYRMAAYHISTYIDWIIRNNPRAFRDIQFVTSNE